MRQFFQANNATRYVMVAECWAGDDQRKEMVSILGEDGCQSVVAIREIVRPPFGRKPYLTKPEYHIVGTGPDRVEGRFSGLLPSRTTH
jgi:hypothetical protein